MTPSELEARALKFLARREYSRRELKARLSAAVEHDELGELDAVLDLLEADGHLSDARYVQQILHARIGHYGRHHILHELKEKGIAAGLIEEALPQIDEAEIDALQKIWRKKFGKIPENQKQKAQQVRFLQSRGFGLDEIFRVIGREKDDE